MNSLSNRRRAISMDKTLNRYLLSSTSILRCKFRVALSASSWWSLHFTLSNQLQSKLRTQSTWKCPSVRNFKIPWTNIWSSSFSTRSTSTDTAALSKQSFSFRKSLRRRNTLIVAFKTPFLKKVCLKSLSLKLCTKVKTSMAKSNKSYLKRRKNQRITLPTQEHVDLLGIVLAIWFFSQTRNTISKRWRSNPICANALNGRIQTCLSYWVAMFLTMKARTGS